MHDPNERSKEFLHFSVKDPSNLCVHTVLKRRHCLLILLVDNTFRYRQHCSLMCAGELITLNNCINVSIKRQKNEFSLYQPLNHLTKMAGRSKARWLVF